MIHFSKDWGFSPVLTAAERIILEALIKAGGVRCVTDRSCINIHPDDWEIVHALVQKDYVELTETHFMVAFGPCSEQAPEPAGTFFDDVIDELSRPS